MPFKYVKKTNRTPVSPKRIRRAVKEHVVENQPLRTTAKKYGIDKMTLRRYAEKFKLEGEDTVYSPNFASNQIFSRQQEVLLASYLLTASKMNYGLTTIETRELAFIFAVENHVKIPQLWKNKSVASKDWLRGFMSRHLDLSIRVPEATSLARSTAFNKHTVGEFYDLLRTVLEREKFTPEAIYNCDETGVQTSHKPRKIITKKGLKHVGKITSAERGTTVTVCCAANAAGNFIPPFLFFQGRKYRNICCLVHHLVLLV